MPANALGHSRQGMRMHTHAWTTLGAALLLAGCSSAARQLYPGPRRAGGEVAIIRAKGVQIVEVDGQGEPSNANIELLPGNHSVVISSRFCTQDGGNSSCYSKPRTCGPLSFAAKAGYEYHALDMTDARGVWVRIQEMKSSQVILGVRLTDYPAVAECFGRPLAD